MSNKFSEKQTDAIACMLRGWRAGDLLAYNDTISVASAALHLVELFEKDNPSFNKNRFLDITTLVPEELN